MVREGGFEPPRLSAPPPQDGVSANSTTPAKSVPQKASRKNGFQRAGAWAGGLPGVGVGAFAGGGAGARTGSATTCAPGSPGTGIAPGTGAAGCPGGVAGCVGAACSPLRTELPPVPRKRFDKIASETEVTIKITASTTVALDKKVAVPRGPKAVWLPMPPKAPARSVPRALCNKTPRIRTTPTKT